MQKAWGLLEFSPVPCQAWGRQLVSNEITIIPLQLQPIGRSSPKTLRRTVRRVSASGNIFPHFHGLAHADSRHPLVNSRRLTISRTYFKLAVGGSPMDRRELPVVVSPVRSPEWPSAYTLPLCGKASPIPFSTHSAQGDTRQLWAVDSRRPWQVGLPAPTIRNCRRDQVPCRGGSLGTCSRARTGRCPQGFGHRSEHNFAGTRSATFGR